jgi:peptide chain release factor 2
VLFELANEENDESTLNEVETELENLNKKIEGIEFITIFSNPDDSKNAILTIHPGAGGTESQDWAEMLSRMYIRWIERKGFSYEIMDLQPGDGAGIKNVAIEVTGDYAYGYLKAEIGIHRLVRLSPFDANHRRHTSFASVFVYPEIDNKIEVDIKDDDLRIDTYRASSAGGQHVNKTSSAIRITHIPTGIVVQCENERSQFKNKEYALKMLYSKLYKLKQEEAQKKKDELNSTKTEIAWGNQIRSYVFHPYNLVKDHRTDVETSNVNAVMDGEIDRFIMSFLKK